MSPSPRTIEKWARIACLVPLTHFGSVVYGQNFSMQVANPDSLGLRSIIPGGESLGTGLGLTDGIKGAFDYGIAANTVYNSNLFITDKNEKSELSAVVAPYINYRSDPEGGAKFTLKANYSPVMRAYLHNSDLNGVDQSGNVVLRYDGSKTMIRAFGLYSQSTGADRLTGDFVTGTLFNGGVQGSYQVAPRTSLMGMWSTAMSSYDSSSSVGSDIYTTEIGAYWAATERFSFGPAIRYLVTESDNISTRDAWSLSMQAQYLVGERIRIMGSLGLEYAANSGGDEKSTLGLTGFLTARYAISERWSWMNEIRYATIPSPAETGYIVNNLLISSALSRNFLRATVEFGVDYNLSDYQSVDSVTTSLANENNLNAYLSYQRNLFSDRVWFNSKVSYAVNDGQTDWNQFQIMTGLTVTF
jgi:hypothetical protein